MHRALFVWLKYLNGDPKYGECGWRNIVEPFSANGVGTWDAFFYDEALAQGKDKDEALLRLCEANRYDVLFVYWMPEPIYINYNIKPETLVKIRETMNIPIVMLFYDTWDRIYSTQAIGLAPVVDLVVVTDSLSNVKQAPSLKKFLNPCYSPSVKQFYNPGLVRDIPLSHNGAFQTRRDRMEMLQGLVDAGVPLFRCGGYESKPLAIDAYAAIFQRSQMTINFSMTPSGTRTFKARVMEATLCGAMLLEQDNKETASRFRPYKDYVPFDGLADLVEKARYYGEHEKERLHIAENGQRRAEELAKPEYFWGMILEKLKEPGLFSLQAARRGVKDYYANVLTAVTLQPAKDSLAALAGRRVAFWGTGSGYRNEFADWMRQQHGHFTVIGFVDNDSSRWGQTFDGYPVFGADEIVGRGVDAVILANHAAQDIYRAYRNVLHDVRFFC